MKTVVVDYQNCCKKTIDILNSNDDVLAVFVFGSIINGDLWEKSDIDMFVILKEGKEKLVNMYSDYLGNYIHYKVLSKDTFLNLKDFELQGSLMHRLFLSSKMMICKDQEIKTKYDTSRFYSDLFRRKWTIAYLSNLIKSVDSAEKAFTLGNLNSAYANCIQSMSYYAMVFLNSSGYMVSKDNISMASNFDIEFKEEFERLISGTSMKKRVEKNIQFLKSKIDGIMPDISDIILAFLKEQKKAISASEAKNDDHFKSFPIDMEGIFEILSEKNYIRKSYREIKSPSGKLLIMENVYSY